MNPALHQELASGAILVTANRRLSRFLRAEFDAIQQAQGKEVWPSVEILPWGAWLERCWEVGLEAEAGLPPGMAEGLLLSDHQAAALWEQVVEADASGPDLLRASEAAARAAEAWGLLKTWRVEPPLGGQKEPGEFRAFRRWRKTFEERCRDGGWVDRASLPELVGEMLRGGAFPPPSALLLAGFDEFTPQQQALLNLLREMGCRVNEIPPPALTGDRMRVACASPAEEWESAARWARHWAEGAGTGMIGVVVAGLEANREAVERIFSDVLAPGAVLPGARRVLPFNITRGAALADYPPARAALSFLKMGLGPLPFEQVSALIRSPFLPGAEQERSGRALLDAELRRRDEPELFLERVRRSAQGRPDTPLLARRLEAWGEAARDLPRRQGAAGWAVSFRALLRTMGWPGDGALTSEEFQVCGKWSDLLAEFAALEGVTGNLTAGEARARLGKMASETQFQPEGEENRIQVMGELEAGGLAFDALWVLGFHDETWPHSPRPNPYLPGLWQRQQNLPHSSAARELEYAQRVTGRLLGAAETVVVSYGRQDGERVLRPSPLFAGLGEVPLSSLPMASAEGLLRVVQGSAAREPFQDERAPALVADGAAPGGTGIFKDQAACPFRAFAAHRLRAEGLALPGHGLSPAARGILVHGLMERVWGRVESYDALLALGTDGTATLAREAAREVVADYVREHPAAMGARFREMEGERLAALARDYLELEKQRAPFQVVGRELKGVVRVGGIEVNTRVDRLDELPDGEHVLIDYKTGRANWKDWFGTAPEEPQLPLYCASDGLRVGGLAFAMVRRGETAFSGLTREPGILPLVNSFDQVKLPPSGSAPAASWEAVLGGWRNELEALGEDFRLGDARVAPKNPAQTCRYCEVRPLCRIDERGDRVDEENGEEGADD